MKKYIIVFLGIPNAIWGIAQHDSDIHDTPSYTLSLTFHTFSECMKVWNESYREK